MLSARDGSSADSRQYLICMSRFEKEHLTVRSEIIDEIQIVGSEINASKWCSRRDCEAGGSTSCQGSIEIWCNGQGAGEGIV